MPDIYVTVRKEYVPYQMDLDDFLFGPDDVGKQGFDVKNPTITYKRHNVPPKILATQNIPAMIERLRKFNYMTDQCGLRDKPREELYRSYKIPKKSGGLRPIDEPLPQLKSALTELRQIFQDEFHVLYHTCAFAYVRGRATIDALQKHVANKSNWYAKFDLHNFFGSTTLEFTMRMLSIVYPFSEIVKDPIGLTELTKAVELGFLRGGLPQGSPLSPFLTNVIMIPHDYELSKKLEDYAKQEFVFTRYADDYQISSRYQFDVNGVQQVIEGVLKYLGAPYTFSDKTRYGSSAGRNWNLGLMINRDNNITIGYRKKKQIKTMLFNYIMDRKNGVMWDVGDLMELQGICSYFRMVEPEVHDKEIRFINQKYGVNVLEDIKLDIKAILLV